MKIAKKKVIDDIKFNELKTYGKIVIDMDLNLNKSYILFNSNKEKIRGICVNWWSSHNGRTCLLKKES